MKESDRLKELKLRNADEGRYSKRRVREVSRLQGIVQKGSYGEKIYQAGVLLPTSVYVSIVIGISFLVGAILYLFVGPVVGLIIFPCLSYYYLSIYLTIRAENRRRKIVPHLPGFVDTLSASLQTGYSMEVSIEHATNALPKGVLKNEFLRIVNMCKKGVPLDETLDTLGHHIAGTEVIALVVTIRLFANLGGRVLTAFARLGLKLREQQSVLERAARDLVGIKQAFFVIFGLSFTAPVFLLIQEPDYILEALKHSWVSYVMQLAVVVQILCFIAFKKIIALRV